MEPDRHHYQWVFGYTEGYADGWNRALETVAADIAELEELGEGWREAAQVTAMLRLKERLKAMEEFDGTGWLSKAQALHARKDAEAIAVGRTTTPVVSWSDIRQQVSPSTWERICRDSSSAAREVG